MVEQVIDSKLLHQWEMPAIAVEVISLVEEVAVFPVGSLAIAE